MTVFILRAVVVLKLHAIDTSASRSKFRISGSNAAVDCLWMVSGLILLTDTCLCVSFLDIFAFIARRIFVGYFE